MTGTPEHPALDSKKLDTQNLALRLGSAAIFAAFFFTLLAYGERPWAKLAFLLALMGALFMAARELILIGRKDGGVGSVVAATLTGWGFLLHNFLGKGEAIDPLPLWAVLFGGMLIIHFSALLSKQNLEKALASQGTTWLAALVLGVGLGAQVKLFSFNDTTLPNTGARLILALYLIVWFGDTAAYFVGSLLGRHKLAPKVSPKKTWEGAGGNFLGNLIGAFLVRAFVCTQWSVIDAIAIALLLGTVGQLGDLVESTWKRSAHVKDSNMGLAIPGHGGMLDRLDSLVFAAPALYAYVHFVHGLN